MPIETPDEFAALEQEGWSDPATALAYATDFAKASEYSIPVMLERAGVCAKAKVLDLCCGHGILAEAAVAQGAVVSGLDFSPAMLDMARARVPQATLVQGDAMALEFEDASFDAVVIGFGIPHVPDATRVFQQAARVLKHGGKLAYSVWEDRDGAMRTVYQAIGAHGAAGIALPPGPGAHDFADPVRADPALEAAGFAQIRHDQVDSRWQVADPLDALRFFEEGTVRGGALLRHQPAQARALIGQAVRDAVILRYGAGPVWDLPMPSVVVSAARSKTP
ncbi:MAG: methyltransferase domain-containing protein [Roseovarius sp.]